MEKIRAQKHLELVTSTLAICEMYTVLKREKESLMKTFKKVLEQEDYVRMLELPIQKQLKMAIEYLLNYYAITVLEDSQVDIENFSLKKVKIQPTYKLLVRIDKETNLRTLDMLHYCNAKYNSEYKDLEIQYLVTSDGLFQKARSELKEDSTILIISPESLIDLEC